MLSNDHRAHAEAMRKHAAMSKDAAVREQFLLMAADWEKLAHEAEELQGSVNPKER